MITLDKSKKLDHKTYFEYPTLFYSIVRKLMEDSHESDYKTYGPSRRQAIMPPNLFQKKIAWYPDDPEYKTSMIGVCVSYYPTNYLKEKVLELWSDPDYIEHELQKTPGYTPPNK